MVGPVLYLETVGGVFVDPLRTKTILVRIVSFVVGLKISLP